MFGIGFIPLLLENVTLIEMMMIANKSRCRIMSAHSAKLTNEANSNAGHRHNKRISKIFFDVRLQFDTDTIWLTCNV